MVDTKLRYLFFILSVIVGLALPAATGRPFLWFGLGGISSELRLSRDKDREIMLRESRKAERECESEILREIETLLPDESDAAIM